MWNHEQKDIWQDIKDTWNNQPQSKKINIQISRLLNEFKENISEFEKESINSDIAVLKVNWAKTKNDKITRFEKESIKKDINIISEFIKKILDKLKG
ncbi:hypothetical protein [Aquimarina litoralis]|uniref:hypothetical protein n=1 Tax=Aquimarina litoralis TaxID=584605 RepID=UPI001C580E4C|nr:hypothetical protein [Aquimarina litoralis]MBW1296309.1 hypothetical protein [Aquimarina litoralis]